MMNKYTIVNPRSRAGVYTKDENIPGKSYTYAPPKLTHHWLITIFASAYLINKIIIRWARGPICII